MPKHGIMSVFVNKAMLSIFYGRRVLRLAQIVPDKKKNGLLAFFLFFPPTVFGKQLFIFIFFPPTLQKNPCRDPSTIEYTEPGLSDILWYPVK